MSRVDAIEKELEEEEFKRRLSVVLESVEDQRIRKWAERKLKYANSRQSSDLIKDLVGNIGKYANILAPNREQFFREFRDTRNFYTHRDDREKHNILEGERLHILTQGLVCLLKAAVLRRIGFSQEQVYNLMNDCQVCVQWCSRVSRQYSQDEVN